MGAADEASACEFIRTFDGPHLDDAMIDRVLERMSSEASYQVYGWDEPVVGHEALRAEFRKQAPLFSDTETEIHAVASVGDTVFVQRTDHITMFGKRGGIDVVGVFRLDDDGKVANWRDYLDSAQIAETFAP